MQDISSSDHGLKCNTEPELGRATRKVQNSVAVISLRAGNFGMAQAGPRPGELLHNIKLRNRPGPSLAARFVNRPRLDPSLGRYFIAGLAPSPSMGVIKLKPWMNRTT